MATTSALDFPPKFWPAQVDHDLLVPILLANAVSYILLGSLVTKICSYLRRYKKDSRLTRGVISSLLFLNVVQAAAQIARDIDCLGLGFGDWERWGDFHSRPQDLMIAIISVSVISLSQATVASRSYLFARSLAIGRLSTADLVRTLASATLIISSLAFGIGTIVLAASYSTLFELVKENDLSLIGVHLYPLFEMMWLLVGTAADISIAWTMFTDARKAKTGFKTSSDSLLQGLVNVALRCGAILALAQTLFNILYFADSPTWADAAHSVLPRVSSLTVVYSITSPREAYRAFLRREEHQAELANVSFERNRKTPPGSPGGRGGLLNTGLGLSSRRDVFGGERRRVVKPLLLVRLGGSRRGTSSAAGLDRREASIEEGTNQSGGIDGNDEDWEEERGMMMEEETDAGGGGITEAASTSTKEDRISPGTVSSVI